MITPYLYVIDASVILKWVFDAPGEDDRDTALVLLNSWVEGKCEFILPSLWLYEVGNIIGRKIPEQAGASMEMLMEYRMEEAAMTAAIAARALSIMTDFGVTFYDAVYHAVALEKKATLVTADAAYLQKAGKLGNAVLLADL